MANLKTVAIVLMSLIAFSPIGGCCSNNVINGETVDPENPPEDAVVCGVVVE